MAAETFPGTILGPIVSGMTPCATSGSSSVLLSRADGRPFLRRSTIPASCMRRSSNGQERDSLRQVNDEACIFLGIEMELRIRWNRTQERDYERQKGIICLRRRSKRIRCAMVFIKHGTLHRDASLARYCSSDSSIPFGTKLHHACHCDGPARERQTTALCNYT